MNENTANGMIEEITTESGETIKLDAMFIMDSIDYVTALVEANVNILKSVRSIIKRGVESGLTASQASAIALEFQKRAAKKSNEMVHYDSEEDKDADEEDKDATEEQLKKDIYEACHIVFDAIEEAEIAKEDILSIFNRIRYVTTADTYALTGKIFEPSNPVCGYGWEEPPEMDIYKEHGKYILELSVPKKLSERKGVKEATEEE